MRKFSLLLLAGVSSQAAAITSDYNTPGDYMVMGDTAHASVTGGKAVFTGATKMTMITQTNPAIKRGHDVSYSFTISNYSSGSVLFNAGNTMMGAATGSNIPAVSLAGLTPVSDNFTTASGIEGGQPLPPDDTDAVSAFRMSCGSGPMRSDDPIVYPNAFGRSHPHQFWGNTGIDASRTTYAKVRARGMTTCGNDNSATTPLNRSGYWMPAMLADDGYARKPDIIKQYYKRIPDSDQGCVAQGATVGTCIPLPHGLRMIVGWKSSDNSQKMSEAGAGGYYNCTDETEGSGTHYSFGGDMNTVIQNAGCIASFAAGKKPHLEIDFGFPECWDGVNVDTPDHRAHMAFPGNYVAQGITAQRCPSTHPYRIPGVQGGVFFTLDKAAFAGKWRLASDSMFSGNVGGATFHTDYFEGWSPTVMTTWYDNCITPHKSCSGGNLGNGTRIKEIGIPSKGGASEQDGFPIGFNYVSPQHLVSTATIGMGKPCRANGVCSGVVKAAGNGEFGLMTENGSMQIDNLVVTPLN